MAQARVVHNSVKHKQVNFAGTRLGVGKSNYLLSTIVAEPQKIPAEKKLRRAKKVRHKEQVDI